MVELGRSKISSRYQVVIPEMAREYLKINDMSKEKECYIYFYGINGEVKIKGAIVETKENVKFLE